MRLCLIVFASIFIIGCGSQPGLRPEPVAVHGTVKLANGTSPKDLTITFQPTQNSMPGGAKVGADGRFEVKLEPGKYAVYFQDEANAKVPAYKSVPEGWRTPRQENEISLSSSEIVINVQ